MINNGIEKVRGSTPLISTSTKGRLKRSFCFYTLYNCKTALHCLICQLASPSNVQQRFGSVRDVQVFTDGKFGEPEIKISSCAPEGKTPRLFENIVIEGAMIDGRPAVESDLVVSGNSSVAFSNP